MMRDKLVDAAAALRETTEHGAPRAAETRARVMAGLRARQARRRAILPIAVPLAAALVGSFAWAAVEGKLPVSLAAWETPKPPSQPLETPVAMRGSAASAADAPDAASSAPQPTADTLPEPVTMGETPKPPAQPASGSIPAPPVSVRAPEAAVPAQRGSRATAVAAIPPPASPSENGDETLYTRAHRLHFVDRNPGAALAAWDAYLRAFPRGRLAVESRYNRALCLVRLNRRSEAAAALAGFAKGSYGGYRQAEARALLDAMESNAP
jgi:hypothetical protein